jgi:hypothetical protein
MRTFFVKIGKAGVPAGIVDPQTRADWETGRFTILNPKLGLKKKRPNPLNGDRASSG